MGILHYFFECLAIELLARDTGYVMFSITETGLIGAVRKFCPTLYLRGTSNGITEKVALCVTKRLLPGSRALAKSRAADTAVDANDPPGKMVLVELSPGNYRFVGYFLTSIYLTGDVVRYLSAPEFEYRFDVVPGSINYVGDLNFTPTNSLGTHFRTRDSGNPNSQAITGTGATDFNFFGRRISACISKFWISRIAMRRCSIRSSRPTAKKKRYGVTGARCVIPKGMPRSAHTLSLCQPVNLRVRKTLSKSSSSSVRSPCLGKPRHPM